MSDNPPLLIIRNGSMRGYRYPLDKGECVIGRGQECDLILTESLVSRLHVKITRREDEYYIEDLDSRNGAWLGHDKLEPGIALPLQDGSEIWLANELLIHYVLGESITEDAAPALSRVREQVNIFISSPGDVRDERRMVGRIIARLNRTFLGSRYYLQALAYEHIVPPLVGDSPQAIIDKYMMQAAKSDILVCVLWSRLGTPVKHPETGEEFHSGTEYEFMSAYEQNQKTGSPRILLYRKMVPPPDDANREQVKRVEQFFERFGGKNPAYRGLYCEYKTLDEFEDLMYTHIEQVIMRNMSASNRITHPKRPSQMEAPATPIPGTQKLDPDRVRPYLRDEDEDEEEDEA